MAEIVLVPAADADPQSQDAQSVEVFKRCGDRTAPHRTASGPRRRRQLNLVVLHREPRATFLALRRTLLPSPPHIAPKP
jgi:hypothetical protein